MSDPSKYELLNKGAPEPSEEEFSDLVVLNEAVLESEDVIDEQDSSEEVLKEPLASKRNKVIYIGFAFLPIFIAWNVAQVFATTLFGSTGSISLGIVYFSFAFVCFVVPLINNKLGVRVCLTLGASGYFCYVLSSAVAKKWLLITASFLIGSGAAFLWISQGVYLTMVAQGESRGYLSGVFLLIFNLNMVIGQLITGVLLKKFHLETGLLLWILTGLCSIGVVMMAFVRPIKSPPKTEVLSPLQNLSNTMKIMKDRKFLLLVPGMIYQGTSSSLTFGRFPRLMPDDQIPFVFLVYGLGLCIGSYMWGKIFDRFSWKVLVASNFVLTTFGYVCTDIGIYRKIPWMFYMYGLGFGFGDACLNNFLNPTLMGVWSQNSLPAFTMYRFITSIMTAFAYFYSPYLNFIVFQCIIYGMLLVSIGCFIALYYRIGREEKSPQLAFSALEVDVETLEN
eukprot:TRINITY_DN4118_c0_g1_i1.p1 TRINITY_DN4118_c0_g1~~TRINITY_DN4118_c0_g1_i1.p1  ORF type:complete len:450 (+),score=75.33 TRINITY_DN4118_c0_g1_i1:142-1491(+)